MNKILKYFLILLGVLVLAVATFFIYATITDYQPEEKITVFTSDNPDTLNDTLEYTLLIWNIGYCGLNAEMDFFYDGGKNVRPEENIVKKNITGVSNFLKSKDSIDFIMLQEVDKASKRSYYLNEYDSLSKIFPNNSKFYGKNYDVFYVPLPITSPMGGVNAGLMTISKYVPQSSVRYSFPGNYSWPLRLAMLDRCFLVNRYPLVNEKELLIINTHNSAYDDGNLKKQQMEYLKTFVEEEYKKGNYVVVGGDWNQCPPNFKPAFEENIMDNEDRTNISPKYLSNWVWAFDNSLPTNRRVKVPYTKGKTLTTVIDFYLLSPNIQSVNIKNNNMNFQYSDHQAVELKIKLK